MGCATSKDARPRAGGTPRPRALVTKGPRKRTKKTMMTMAAEQGSDVPQDDDQASAVHTDLKKRLAETKRMSSSSSGGGSRASTGRMTDIRFLAKRLSGGSARTPAADEDQRPKALRPKGDELLNTPVSSGGGSVEHASALDSDLVRFQGIRMTDLKKFWADIAAAPSEKRLALYETRQDLPDARVAKGRTLALVRKTSQGRLVCRAPLSDLEVEVDPGQVAFKEFAQWTLEDVCEFAVVPRTQKTDCFFADTCSDDEAFGPAFHGAFVIHSRAACVASLLQSLEAHFASRNTPLDQAYVWIDVFCANQPLLTRKARRLAQSQKLEAKSKEKKMADNQAQAQPQEDEGDRKLSSLRRKLINSTLHKAQRRFQETIVFLEDWRDPAPIKRAWCLWEIYGAATSERPLSVLFNEGGKADVLAWLRAGRGGEELLQALASIDVRAMQSRDAADLAAIRKAMLKLRGGLPELKATITWRLMRWVLEEVEQAVLFAEREAESPAQRREFANVLVNAGGFMRQMGELDIALSYFGKAAEIFARAEGPQAASVAMAKHRAAVVRHAQERYEEAFALFDEALFIKRAHYGARHMTVADLLHNMASTARALHEYAEAADLYIEALSIKRAIVGEKHASVANTLHDLAFVRRLQGQCQLSLELYAKALAIYRTTLGQNHAAVAQTLNNMGAVNEALGKFDEALGLYKQALSLLKDDGPGLVAKTSHSALPAIAESGSSRGEAEMAHERGLAAVENPRGTSHRRESVADALEGMAVVKDAQGKRRESLELLQEALAIRRASVTEARVPESMPGFTDESKDLASDADPALSAPLSPRGRASSTAHGRRSSVADTLKNMALVSESQGKHDEAMDYFEEALAIRRDTLGERDLGVADMLSGISATKMAQGKFDEALAIFDEVLAIKSEQLGERHVAVAETLNDLGALKRAQGKYDEELEYYERALSIRRASLGSRHRSVADILNNMGGARDVQGKYEEALQLYTEALSIYEDAAENPEADPAVATTLNNMGIVKKALGHFNESLELYERALEMKRRVWGDQHLSVADTMSNVAAIKSFLGDHEEAIILYEKALIVKREALGHDHLLVAETMLNMGVVEKGQGKLDAALERFTKTLAIQRAHGDRHLRVAQTLNNMAVVKQEQGRYAESLALSKEALEIKRSVLGSRHASVADTLNNMAIAKEAIGNGDEALKLYEEALSIRRATLGDRHVSVADTLNNMAIVKEAQGSDDEALAMYAEALSIRKAALHSRHSAVADTLNNMSVVKRTQGKYEEALALNEEALQIHKEALGEHHPSLGSTMFNMALLQEALGNSDAALEYAEGVVRIWALAFGEDHVDTRSARSLVEDLRV